MYQPLIALAVFGGLVWMISQAILMLLRGNGNAGVTQRRGGTLEDFVEQNYGARFVPENPLGDEGMRKL